MGKNSKLQLIVDGIVKNNPTFVLVLGMCPTLGTTTSAIARFIPDKVRIPSYIVVIASFVTIVQLLLQAYVPVLYEALGIFLPLIVVNCIILGRAEAFANKNSVGDSALDGVGIGLGFTIALTAVGLVREILGSGSAFGLKFIQGDGMLAFVLAPGAFIVLAYLMVIFRKITKKA